MTHTATPGPLLGSGRYTDIFDLGDGRVLRRYRERAKVADREAEVMVHARAHGVPVPEVFDASGTDIVMERADGPTMLRVLAQRPWTLRRQARLLVALHELVHAVPGPGWLRAPFGEGTVLLHTDLHPENVILTPFGPRLIDWQGAVRGPAEADLALTWVLIASSQVPGPVIQRAVGRTGQGLFSATYMRAVGYLGPEWLARAVEHRLKDPSLHAGEERRLRRLLADGRLPGRRRG